MESEESEAGGAISLTAYGRPRAAEYSFKYLGQQMHGDESELAERAS